MNEHVGVFSAARGRNPPLTAHTEVRKPQILSLEAGGAAGLGADGWFP